MSTGLHVEGVVAGYGAKNILHGVSFHVPPHASLTVVGPNGSGKSTLMKAVVGLLPLRAGRVLFNGVDLTGLPVHERVRGGIGYVPQEYNVFRNLTVRENLKIGHEFGVARTGFDARLAEVLTLFPEIVPRLSALAGHLSGGQRQMVAMATALMPTPTLLVLDEPSAGLSPRNASALFAIVRRVVDAGVSLLMIEQNVREALACADEGLVLANGEVRAHRQASALLADTQLQDLYFGVQAA